MPDPRRRRRRPVARPAGEAGLTAVEVVVASAMLVVVLALVLPLIVGGFDTVRRQGTRVDGNDQAYLALNQVERDVRSGNVITVPGPVAGQPGMEVRIYTQTRGTPMCVQYRVAGGSLERRTRPPGPVATHPWPAQWSVVAEGVENAAWAPAVAAFTRSSDRQMLTVDLVVNRAERADAAVRVTSTVTGRNTKYYDTPFSEEKCD